jgi:hypothetical protein
MPRPALALCLLALAAGCAARESGIRDPADFLVRAERTTIASARPAAEVAACFEREAAHLPGAAFAQTAEGGAADTLRGFGFAFEQALFENSSGGGSTATVLLAPGLEARWRADFARDRLAPLQRCAAAQA